MSIVISNTRPAESTHWYTRDGEPMYTVTGKNGKERPTTLRDARKFDLVPSVTTILNVAAKPALMQWMQRQVLMAALTLPKIDAESEDEYIERIIQDSKEQGRAAADLGTKIHASIQSFYEGKQYWADAEEVKGCDAAIQEHFGKHEWTCERAFSHDLGFGGKVDMYADGIVLDIKTKDFKEDDKLAGYDEHLMQLAAYRVGLGMPMARCANVFVSRSVPGLAKVYEWSDEDLKRGWSMFCALLEFWQLKNNHE